MPPTLPTLRRAVRAATPALAVGTAALTAILAACADSPTSPTSPVAAGTVRAPSVTGPLHATGASSSVIATVVAGDTTVTTFVVGTGNQSNTATFPLGNGSKIQFTGGASAICDPRTSSYGPGTWDSPCSPSLLPVTITARTWVDPVTGKTRSAFSPALRFVPTSGGNTTSVQLFLKDPNYTPGGAIWYCPDGASQCVNEGLTDPSLNTVYNSGSRWIYRIIKHFSGYAVLV